MTQDFFKDYVQERETSIFTPVKVRTDVCIDPWDNYHMGAVCMDHNGAVLDVSIGQIGSGFTINEAEAEAMIRVLRSLNEGEVEHVKAYVDNEPCLDQIESDGVLDCFEMATIEQEGREYNELADMLAETSKQIYVS